MAPITVELATVPELVEDTVVADGMDPILNPMMMERVDTDFPTVISTGQDLAKVHILAVIGKIMTTLVVVVVVAKPKNRVRSFI
jgi:hypothetical protein